MFGLPPVDPRALMVVEEIPLTPWEPCTLALWDLWLAEMTIYDRHTADFRAARTAFRTEARALRAYRERVRHWRFMQRNSG